MANQELININFTQFGNICALASYGTIIEYFSESKIEIEKVLSSYSEKFEIFRDYPEVFYFKTKHEKIGKHFDDYCKPKNIRGFNFIKMLHENNDLNTKVYCQIIDSEALERVIDDNCKNKIRDYLINHDALAMVLYKVNGVGYHAVTIGYDSKKKNYFYIDSNLTGCQIGDILSQKEITEYIIFSK